MSKRSTDNMHALDIRKIARAGLLTPGRSFTWQWSRGGRQTASIALCAGDDRVTLNYRTRNPGGDWRDMNYPVRIERTPCHFGGARVWWQCPGVGCGRRVAVLFGGGVYACRHCHDLAYESTRSSPETKAFARADKVRQRLGWVAGIAHPPGDRPKGMHQQTYWRWLTVYNTLANQAFGASSAALGKMVGRLKG